MSCYRCGGSGEEVCCIDDICHGLGYCIHGDGMRPCPVCGGDDERMPECQDCGGSGETEIGDQCGSCFGSGLAWDDPDEDD